MADKLVTEAQVKTRLGITDATDDGLIGELIEQVTDYIQTYTGRQLVATSGVTYVVDTAPGSAIEVPRGIRAVTALSVASSDQPDTGGSYTAIAAADVLLRPAPIDRQPGWPATSILIRGTYARLGRGWINGATVTGDWGFAAVPPAIQAVAIDVVTAAYVVRRQGASGVIGADETAVTPWAAYFAWGSPQRQTLLRYRAGQGIA